MADWTRIAWPPDSLIDHWAMEENTVKRFKNIIFKGYFCGNHRINLVDPYNYVNSKIFPGHAQGFDWNWKPNLNACHRLWRKYARRSR